MTYKFLDKTGVSRFWTNIKSYIDTNLNKKQDTLTAGSNIQISGSTISATDTTYSAATTSANGLMSSSDKTKLDGIATGATNVTTSTVSGWGYTKNTGTITGITMNGSSKGTSGVVDLGTVITAHQDISGKQDTLVSGTNIKTVNNNSLLGSGNVSVGTITGITMNSASKGTSGVVDLGTVITAHQDISGKANDSAVVHKTGDESINGTKNFIDMTKHEGPIYLDWEESGGSIIAHKAAGADFYLKVGTGPDVDLTWKNNKVLDTSDITSTATSGSAAPFSSGGAYTALSAKQDTLVSGTNIKTINNNSLLGSGNIEISASTSDCVHLTGAETITGIKTFSGSTGITKYTNGAYIDWYNTSGTYVDDFYVNANASTGYQVDRVCSDEYGTILCETDLSPITTAWIDTLTSGDGTSTSYSDNSGGGVTMSIGG